jgi:2'-5' RNA ligase
MGAYLGSTWVAEMDVIHIIVTPPICCYPGATPEPLCRLRVTAVVGETMMRVAFAFLVDETAHNTLRKWALDAHRRFRTGFLAAQLPPHVSLKQPFLVHDLAAIEAYFDHFASTLAPVSLTLTYLDVRHMPLDLSEEQVILWADVQETPDLRVLHERLNSELVRQFGATGAPFDGPAYHFHATVSMGIHPSGTHQVMYQEYAGTCIAYAFVATHLALFYYEDDSFAPASYFTYRIVRVGPSEHG